MHRILFSTSRSTSARLQLASCGNVRVRGNVRHISATVPRLAEKAAPTASASTLPPAPAPAPDVPATLPDLTAADTVSTTPMVTDAAAALATSWHPFDLVSQLVQTAHLYTGLPYWAVIIGTTVGVRLLCVPLGVKAVQNSARMAAIRPKMNKLIAYSKENPNNTSYQKELFLLWKQNNVNPLKALAVPLIQLPLFVTFFFGIRQMGNYYPALAEGGVLWFPDLVMHDPLFMLPVLNGASFLLMVELNAHDQAVESDQAATFKTAMRALAFFMVPVTMYTPAAVFMYWIPNNLISLAQTRVLKTESLKRYFNIPNPPPVDPFAPQEEGAMEKLQKAWDSTFKRGVQEGDVQVIDGDGGDGSRAAKKATPARIQPASRPPTTYTQKPPSTSKKSQGKKKK